MSRNRLLRTVVVSLCLVLSATLSLAQLPGEEPTLSQRVAQLVDGNDVEAFRQIGPQAIPAMIWLYDLGDDARRIRIANLLYKLEWKSPEAERTLMVDIRTANVDLRLAVQYALGKVSDDPQVVETLLDILRNDRDPLFRDKAACALAYDQVHLTEAQRTRVYEGLIQALSSPEPHVQAVSIQALSILTGQTKGFHPLYPDDRKQRSIAMWEKWLADHKASL